MDRETTTTGQATGKNGSQGLAAAITRQFSLTFDAPIAPFALLIRVVMGWIFLWAGFNKLINGFTAEGFLLHATSGPLQGWFNDLGGNAAALSVIDPLVTYSQVLMGFALFFGAATRLTLFFAAAMMFMFYISQFPPEHDLFVDYYIVYIITYAMLGALGAGRVLGLDLYIEKLPVVHKYPRLKYLLG